METITITPEALQSFQMLMRLSKELDGQLPGVALVKNQAEAVDDVMEGRVTIEAKEEGPG